MLKPLVALFSLVLLVSTGCSSGEDGGNTAPAADASARPWAIDDAALTGAGTDLLVGGDQFIGDLDPGSAAALGDQIWATLTGVQTWVAENPVYTYRFYDDTDPVTNWGRAFRYTGFDVVAGPIIGPPGFYGTGTYVTPAGQPFDAVILRTWDSSYWEILIVQDAGTIVHAIQHVNGLPIARGYAGQ